MDAESNLCVFLYARKKFEKFLKVWYNKIRVFFPNESRLLCKDGTGAASDGLKFDVDLQLL